MHINCINLAVMLNKLLYVYCFSSAEFAKNVTFPEFVRYVLWERRHKTQVNAHWRPQYDICRPCHIKYDAIVFYETMPEDANYVLHEINAGPNVKFPPRSSDNRLPTSSKYMALYENVPIRDIRRLLHLYRKDYITFGYEIPSIISKKLDNFI